MILNSPKKEKVQSLEALERLNQNDEILLLGTDKSKLQFKAPDKMVSRVQMNYLFFAIILYLHLVKLLEILGIPQF